MLLIKLMSFISLIIADTSGIIIASMTDRNLYDGQNLGIILYDGQN